MAKKKKNRKPQNQPQTEQRKDNSNLPAAKSVAPKKDNSSKSTSKAPAKKNDVRKSGSKSISSNLPSGYLWKMKYAPKIDDDIYSFHMIPISVFVAVIIMIVRQFRYATNTSNYYWSPQKTEALEFFSHYKADLIVICTVVALVLLLYRLVTQSLAIKKSLLYIPMGIYLLFVLLSCVFSEQKSIAWIGWSDRFEGTLVIICYILMLFYVINTVNSEKNIKWVIYPVAVTTAILSLIGLGQATGHDFFRSEFGQKLIVPNEMLSNGSRVWDIIEQSFNGGSPYLDFQFKHNEIYQSVYNINYVSFYLTLLIPLFGLLFIMEHKIWKKSLWGLLFSLLIFNMIGAASANGYLGLGVSVILAVIIFRKKVIEWWKPLLILVVITILIGGATYSRWSNEIIGAARGFFAPKAVAEEREVPALSANDSILETAAGGSGEPAEQSPPPSVRTKKLDYFITQGDKLIIGYNGHEVTIFFNADEFRVNDETGAEVAFLQDPETKDISLDNENFAGTFFTPSMSEDGDIILVFHVAGDYETQWPFTVQDGKMKYINALNKTTDLVKVPHIGFENNSGFGSGRGYIWSRSFPMIKDTIFIGNGADTYCLYFPHRDYVGKYNAGWKINMVVDKPHSFYIATAINTGLISLLALLALFGLYIVQSFKLYWKLEYDNFTAFAGVGIFLGVCGFLAAAIVNDSTVSVMPLFYGLLGVGIAVNILLKRQANAE